MFIHSALSAPPYWGQTRDCDACYIGLHPRWWADLKSECVLVLSPVLSAEEAPAVCWPEVREDPPTVSEFLYLVHRNVLPWHCDELKKKKNNIITQIHIVLLLLVIVAVVSQLAVINSSDELRKQWYHYCANQQKILVLGITWKKVENLNKCARGTALLCRLSARCYH